MDERHAVEEAMTKALLKTCPKCGKQILKQDGCNKVVCFCGGMMCDYCGKDITKDGYNHFSGPGAGGMGSSKKCPTHDNTEQRRKAQVDKAEAEAIKKAREENPDLTEEQLKLKFSKEVEIESSTLGVDPLAQRMPRVRMPNLDAFPQDIRERIQHRYAHGFNFGDAPQIPGANPQPMPHRYQQQHIPAAGNAAIPQPHPAYVPQHPLPQPLVYPGGFGIGFGNPPPPLAPNPELTDLQQRFLAQQQRNRALLDYVGLGRQPNAAAAPAPGQQLDHPMPDYHQPNFGVGGAGGGAMPDAYFHGRRLAFAADLAGQVPPPGLGDRRAGDAENWNFGGEDWAERRQRRQNR